MRIEVNVTTGEIIYHEEDITVEAPIETPIQPTVEDGA